MNLSNPRSRRAFTLIEMMITTGLLAVIVIGLTAMFVHTQKAFKAGTNQTDVLESGRAAIELMSRELENLAPSRAAGVTNFYSRYEAYSTNALIGGSSPRTNALSCFFALALADRKWSGIGYLVALPTNYVNKLGIGTLYRFEFPLGGTNGSPSVLSNIGSIFQNGALFAVNDWSLPVNSYQGQEFNISTNLTRVCDGVVGLRVTAYDLQGNAFSFLNGATNALVSGVPDFRPPPGNDFPVVIPRELTNGLSLYEYTFMNNAVPAYLDLELSIMESTAWERFKAIPSSAPGRQAAYLSRQVAAIHVFRRRVAIHNVDREAYP